jgi:hypothetical protein
VSISCCAMTSQAAGQPSTNWLITCTLLQPEKDGIRNVCYDLCFKPGRLSYASIVRVLHVLVHILTRALWFANQQCTATKTP